MADSSVTQLLNELAMDVNLFEAVAVEGIPLTSQFGALVPPATSSVLAHTGNNITVDSTVQEEPQYVMAATGMNIDCDSIAQ